MKCHLHSLNAKPAERPYKVTDGAGLFLLVNPNGAKYWRLAYRYLSRQKTLALGVYPQIGLAEARKSAIDAKSLLQQGCDPAISRIQKRLEQRLGNDN